MHPIDIDIITFTDVDDELMHDGDIFIGKFKRKDRVYYYISDGYELESIIIDENKPYKHIGR